MNIQFEYTFESSEHILKQIIFSRIFEIVCCTNNKWAAEGERRSGDSRRRKLKNSNFVRSSRANGKIKILSCNNLCGREQINEIVWCKSMQIYWDDSSEMSSALQSITGGSSRGGWLRPLIFILDFVLFWMCPTSIKLVALWGPFHEFETFHTSYSGCDESDGDFKHHSNGYGYGRTEGNLRSRSTFPCHCGPTAALLLLFRWSYYYCLLVYLNRFPEPCKSYSRVFDRQRVWDLKNFNENYWFASQTPCRPNTWTPIVYCFL